MAGKKGADGQGKGVAVSSAHKVAPFVIVIVWRSSAGPCGRDAQHDTDCTPYAFACACRG